MENDKIPSQIELETTVHLCIKLLLKSREFNTIISILFTNHGVSF